MRKARRAKLAFAFGLIGVGSLGLTAAPSAAQPGGKDPILQDFLADVRAYVDQCKGDPNARQASPQQCANQKAELQRRQKPLHLTDAEVNKLLDGQVTRGSIGRNPYP